MANLFSFGFGAMSKSRCALGGKIISVLAAGLILATTAQAQPGGARGGGGNHGGGRPSMGHVGGSGARPSMARPSPGAGGMARPSPGAGGMARPMPGGAGMQRPAGGMPSAQRPATSPMTPSARPSFGNSSNSPAMSRPAPQRPAATTRPVPGAKPELGGSRPSLGGLGAGSSFPQPSTRPALPDFGSSASRPDVTRPATRPAMPGGTLPGQGLPGSVRPSPSPRPGGADRPSVQPPAVKPPINRPDNKLPPGLSNADRPEGINRPGISQDRPGSGEIATRPVPRPLPGDLTRPARPERPSLGGAKPNFPTDGADRPGIERPNPGRPNNDRPGIDRPGVDRPNPGRPGTDRPTVGRPGVDRPNIDRPNIDRPNPGRPGTDRPVIDRPGTNRPGVDRPIIGGSNDDRPWGNRPNRPDWGQAGGGTGNRPTIGGNRPNIGNEINVGSNNVINNITNNITNVNNNNVNVNLGNQFVNRPGWDFAPGFSRPGWGIYGNSWYDRWQTNVISYHHRGWYNGCWHGYWGSSWYAPVSVFAVGWGLGAVTNTWGMGAGFYNPYFVASASPSVVSYDYSQPLVVNNYRLADDQVPASQSPPLSQGAPADAQEAGLAVFDRGLASFRDGNYHAALSSFTEALKDRPRDPVVHEVRSLTQFALGDFQSAAAGLNSLLASAPGMDWTTMSGLYGNPDDYTRHLRRLEEFASANPDDAAAHFVLAYHYLVLGSKDAAIDALKTVVELQPRDVTAQRMLEALSPSQPSESRKLPTESERDTSEKDTTAAPAEAAAEAESQQTDLVGIWKAEAGGAEISLTISEASEFSWKAMAPGQPATELSGTLVASENGIQLVSPVQGTLAGSVTSGGPNSWTFRIDGSPASDPGLVFARIE
jgi:tetratricopeptide (TPR) repeat protein